MKTTDETAIIRAFAIIGYTSLGLGLLAILISGVILSQWHFATQAGLVAILTGYICLFISKEPSAK